MRTGNQAWDALLGALVGVVRAEQKNAKTVETDRVLFEGFAALAEDDETALQKFAITERLIEIAPGMLCKLDSGELGEDELFVFHKAVFALGEDWSPEELEKMLETLN